MLEISHVDTFYGMIQALWDVSLSIEEAEIVALVGANGAGKTTLLNTVSGLLHPTSGSIEFLGRRMGLITNLHGQSTISRRIRIIQRNRLLLLSVRQGLELVLAYVNTDPVEPCGKGGFEPEFPQGPIDLHEGLLGCIIGFLIIPHEPIT